MMRNRWWGSGCAAVLLALACGAQENATNRLTQLQEQITQTQALIAETTNTQEKAHWQERLNLLEQDRTNLQQRLVLEGRERTLSEQRLHQADYRLREALRAINTDISAPSNEFSRIDFAIRLLKVQRGDLERNRLDAAAATPINAEQVAELEQQLRVTDEDIAARLFEREAAEARMRLVGEANRIDETLRRAELNPSVTLRLLREKQARLNATLKARQDIEDLLALNRQQRAGVAAALALSQEKAAHLEAEQVLLNKKSSGVKGWFRSQFFSASAEKKHLTKRMQLQQQQLAAMDEIIGLNTKLRELLDCEAACLQGERAALLARFEQRLLWPLGLLAGLLALYLLVNRLVVKRLIAKDHQIVGHRVTGYLCTFAGLVVLVLFFFEDLRSVATILGIASAAVVIALQDMCSAFAGWFAIMSGRKFAVGHRIEIDGNCGDVIDIQLLRTTLVEINNWLGVDEPTGRIIVVPNSFVFRSKFFNYSYLHPYIWSKLDITVTYETPVGEAEAVLRRALEEETREEFAAAREAAKTVEQRYGVSDAVYQPKFYTYIADSGVQFRLVYCSHYKRVGATRNRIFNRILKEFEANPQLQFAYPTERHIPTPEKGGLPVALNRPA